MVKSVYLDGTMIRASFVIYDTILALQEEYIFVLVNKTIYTIKIKLSGSRAATAKFFITTNSTYLEVWKTSIIVYNLHLNSHFKKLIFIFFRVRKSIFNAIFILMSAIRKII